MLWILRNWAMLLSSPLAMLKAFRSHQVGRAADRMKAIAILGRLRLWRFVKAHHLAVGG